MAIVGISGSLLQGGNTDRLGHSLLGLSLLVHFLKRRSAALLLTGQVIFLLACAWADAGEQPAPPASSKAPATSAEPKYLVFWSSPEKAGELAERVGMKGDGKTRLLGFGLPNATYELEAHLPSRIRSAFAAAREHDMAVMLHFDFHLAWKNRPDLWNWFDPDKPSYSPNNKYNVEWHGWDGPPNKVRYLNWGVLERLPPNMCFTSKRTRAEVTRIVSKVIGPVLREEIAKLKAEGKEALFAGVVVGSEPSIDDYSKPNPECTKMMKEDGVPAGPLGYRALLDRGFSADLEICLRIGQRQDPPRASCVDLLVGCLSLPVRQDFGRGLSTVNEREWDALAG